MTIRPVTDKDIQAIAKIYTENWKTTYRGLLPDSFLKGMTDEHSKEKWLSYIHTDKQGAFAAVDEDDMIIGFASYKPYDDLKKCLLLDSLHVLQSVQGGGLGKKLIFAIGKYAYNNGYERMSICIVKGNDRAEGIYTHLGAKHYKDFIDDFQGTPSNSSVLLWDDLKRFKENEMFPNKEIAENELRIAGQLNQGPWVQHSINVGLAAQMIAERCCNLNPNKAYVLGLLHDIGRRYGVSARRHGIDGYNFAIEKGWSEIGRICLTHSFPVPDFDKEIRKNDMSDEESEFVMHYLKNIKYDDYDKLIILCDSLADAQGFCMLEKRFVNTTRRYGVFSFTVERWNATFKMKEYFEEQMGCSVYDVLPNIKETTFMDAPLWKPPVK